MGIPPGFPTMPSLLRGAGYRTALIGKWHLGFLPRYSPLRSGYDEFFGIMGGFTSYYTHVGEGGAHDLYEAELPAEQAGYVTDLLSERARAYVEAAANSPEPYFLSLHYNAPHWPWSAPSIEAAARQREVDPAEMMEGGSPRIYGEMMENLDAGIGRVMDAVRRSGKDTRQGIESAKPTRPGQPVQDRESVTKPLCPRDSSSFNRGRKPSSSGGCRRPRACSSGRYLR